MSQADWEASVAWVGIVSGNVIKQDGKYLMVQEKQEKAYGLWNLPAGFVDKGETIEQAAIREAKEETGYTVELLHEVLVAHESATNPVKHAFLAKVTGGELTVDNDEIMDVKWLTFSEIEALNNKQKIRAAWVWDAINKVEASN